MHEGKKPPSEGKSAPTVLSVFTHITTYIWQQIPPRSDGVNERWHSCVGKCHALCRSVHKREQAQSFAKSFELLTRKRLCEKISEVVVC